MPRKLPYPKYTLRSRLLVMSSATFLLCAGVILMFFPFLKPALENVLDSSVQRMQIAKKIEATTITRIIVMELSLVKELLETQPGRENEVDQRIMDLIWQKVTFNKVIQGIELIQAQSDAQGEHLTYLFYRREAPELKPMGRPQKKKKKFTAAEKELLDYINTRKTVDRRLQEIVNHGPKEEGPMLLRYQPVHVLLPEEGAIYWGVAKIGIDVSGLPQLLALQSQGQAKLHKEIWLAIILSLTVSGILAVSLLYLWARRLTEPLRSLSAAARDFKSAQPSEYGLWLENLDRVDPADQTEVADLKETLVRLAKAIPRLGERLFASEHQACLSRVAARAFPTILADRLEAELTAWQRFAAAPEKEWQTFDLGPILTSAWRLATLGLPSQARLACELETLPPVKGSPGLLGRAVLYLLDYAAGVLPPDGQLTLKAGPRPAGGLQVVVAVAGTSFSAQDCRKLLNPLEENGDFTGTLGPALAAAIALQHGGALTAQPGEPRGLIFFLALPTSPPDHAEREPYI